MDYEFTFYPVSGGKIKKVVCVEHVKSDRTPVVKALASDMELLINAGFELCGARFDEVGNEQ